MCPEIALSKESLVIRNDGKTPKREFFGFTKTITALPEQLSTGRLMGYECEGHRNSNVALIVVKAVCIYNQCNILPPSTILA